MESIAALIFSLLVLGSVVFLLRGRGLREKYAFLWLFVGMACLVLTAIPGMLRGISSLIGVQVPSNLLFAMGIIFLTGVALHLSWEVSVLEEEARTLSEETAIGRARLEELERKVEALSSAASNASRTPATPELHGHQPADSP
ncbi:DUF2304 domain-containing protein [Arthrobacter sp. W4I7]|uniref:DUF2304 domain-containing protein n=1 Tax=Arthrobacter sp. W4I7 TaxID=3042296 RepID=UPI00278729A0|nr:DUF2304 domain-containing protein [Arthrobacter sp. W4I7]MDQ0690383.1 hypothetical protein [Arthrobacter sp. W4I7]